MQSWSTTTHTSPQAKHAAPSAHKRCLSPKDRRATTYGSTKARSTGRSAVREKLAPPARVERPTPTLWGLTSTARGWNAQRPRSGAYIHRPRVERPTPSLWGLTTTARGWNAQRPRCGAYIHRPRVERPTPTLWGLHPPPAGGTPCALAVGLTSTARGWNAQRPRSGAYIHRPRVERPTPTL